MSAAVRTVRLPDGTEVPALGQGTWMMGEVASHRADEIAAIRAGVDLGLTLIDTAEMYGSGSTEQLLGDALAGLRSQVYLVSKALPDNASRSRLLAACEGSLKRLKTDRIDLYLLHWRGRVPLAETVEAMQRLVEAGKIRAWGVSNLDTVDMVELVDNAGGAACATNQILYNLTRRGPEFDLLPWLAQHGMPMMAYSPVEQGRLLNHPALAAIASRLGVAPVQVALAWVLRDRNVVAIPKAGSVAHVTQNHACLSLTLDADSLAELDRAFPKPTRKTPLALL